jgi:hypothetical protein
MLPLWLRIWGFRVAFIAGLVALCALDDSPDPAYAFCVAWGPNGLFLVLFTNGLLRLPRFLERVYPMERVLYHWLGVAFVKRIVATRMWPRVVGFSDPPPVLKTRRALLHHVDAMTKGAEVCHATTFALATGIALACLAFGRYSTAAWISAFNMLLNGYPVMLQRSNRWRVQQLAGLQHSQVPGGVP